MVKAIKTNVPNPQDIAAVFGLRPLTQLQKVSFLRRNREIEVVDQHQGAELVVDF